MAGNGTQLINAAHLPKGTVGVAVSGGVDSMCLLHCLHAAGVPVVALTVEHGIRGEESVQDMRLVQEYAARLGVRVVCKQVDAPAYAKAHKMGLEQAARVLRYAFFEDVLATGQVDCIVTAHHADDLCESMLLNMARGCGLRGLCGIVERERYVRPLLGVTRADIMAYAESNNVPYRQDGTNTDIAFDRNFIRIAVLPVLEQRYPHYRDSLLRLSDTCREQVDLLNELAIAPTVQSRSVTLPLQALTHQHIALAKWSIRQAVRLFDGGVDFEACNLAQVLELANARNNAYVCLPNGVRAAKEYDAIAFWRASADDTAEYPFAEGRFAFGDRCYTVRPFRQGDALRFDMDAVPQGAVLRLRRQGDAIAKFGGGTKSLGDYYTDKKIPVRLREQFPVVAIDNRVLVCCCDIARDVAVQPTTKRIFTLLEEEE